jgi:hyperosmotically inducible protein
MRQMAAALILLALFVVLVGSRFSPADGDKLAAVSRLTAVKLRDALPTDAALAGPVGAFRRGLPDDPAGRVKARLETDRRLAGLPFTVSAEGEKVTLRGVVPDAAARKRAVSLAENTAGVGEVVDELAVPAGL